MVLQNLQTRKSNVSDLWHNLMQGFYLDMVFLLDVGY